MYKLILRPLLFLFSPETSHHLALKSLAVITSIPGLSHFTKALFKFDHSSLKVNLWGLDFPNPVGLAAGFDKDGKYIKALDALGFGFIEVGTVTPVGQEGNPQPRLFRLKPDRALINRMGFNNEGVDALVGRLKSLDRTKINAIIGGNIGKNKETPNEKAHLDYLKCYQALHAHVDYFVVNVSSPNTPGLRALQDRDSLHGILTTLIQTDLHKLSPKPILLKISPDLTPEAIAEIVALVQELGIHGIITSNTTLSRDNLLTAPEVIDRIGAGGLSGKILKTQADKVLTQVKLNANDDLGIIAVGGIETGSDAKDKLEAGADMIQLYTGFIYEGPFVVKRIKKALVVE